MILVTPVGLRDSAWKVLRASSVAPSVFAVLATAALAFALLAFPSHANLVLHVYIVALGLLGLWVVTGVISDAYPAGRTSSIELALRRRRPPAERLEELQKIENAVSFAGFSAFDYHYRLRPLLREVADQRLAAHWNVNLSADSRAAKKILGDHVWVAITSGEHPDDRDAPGIKIAELGVIVSRLESL